MNFDSGYAGYKTFPVCDNKSEECKFRYINYCHLSFVCTNGKLKLTDHDYIPSSCILKFEYDNKIIFNREELEITDQDYSNLHKFINKNDNINKFNNASYQPLDLLEDHLDELEFDFVIINNPLLSISCNKDIKTLVCKSVKFDSFSAMNDKFRGKLVFIHNCEKNHEEIPEKTLYKITTNTCSVIIDNMASYFNDVKNYKIGDTIQIERNNSKTDSLEIKYDIITNIETKIIPKHEKDFIICRYLIIGE